MNLSKRARELKPSATLSIDAKAQQLKREGKDIINLSAGQPDFNTPDYIKEAGKEGIDKNFTRYVPVPGMVEFKDAICAKFKRENDLEYAPNQVIVGTGGKQILYNAAQALLDPGDEAIIPSPFWVSYLPMVELAGGKAVFLDTHFEDQFQINPDALKAAITDKTRFLFMNSPSNPTGSLYTKEKLIEVGKICAEKNVFILSDEIYEYLTYDGNKAWSLAALDPAFKDITLTINGLSKAFAMTGWRIGYGGGPQELIGAMTRIQGHSTSNASSIAQYAGVTALTKPLDTVMEMVVAFEKRRDYAYDRVTAMPDVETFKPGGAFYIFPKVDAYYGREYNGFKITDSMTFCQFMLEEQLLAVVPGAPFGNNAHIRMSYANSIEELEKAFDRFEEGLKKLQ